MKRVFAITKKEFFAYFNSPIAYIFITVFLMLTSWLFFRGFFIINQADMRPFFDILPWLFLFFVPAITMRLWAEERKTGTFEILMTLPIKSHELVLGKFFASFLFLALTIALTFPLPITIFLLGKPDLGPLLGGYLGVLLMGGAYLSIGIVISSFTENQIIAFILSVVTIFFFLIIGEDIVLFSVPSLLVPIFDYLGLGTHFESISRGVIDSRDLIFYFTVIGFFLFVNVCVAETKK